MNSFTKFITQQSFRTLPNGKIVFFNKFAKPPFVLIPDDFLDPTFRNKVFWVNFYLLLFGIASFVIFLYFTKGKYISTFLFAWVFLISEPIRYFFIKKDISGFPQINIKYETTFFYDNFTNKVEIGKNKIPLGYKIAKYLDVSENDDKILLLQYKGLTPIVLRCALGGWIIWQTQIDLDYNDVSSNMEWQNNQILLSNSSVSPLLLDASTGSVVKEK